MSKIVTQNVPAQPVVRVTNPLLVLAEDSSDSQGGDEGEEELVAGTPPHKKVINYIEKII